MWILEEQSGSGGWGEDRPTFLSLYLKVEPLSVDGGRLTPPYCWENPDMLGSEQTDAL